MQKLQAIAQNGLIYSKEPYDIKRYNQLQDVISEIIANYSNKLRLAIRRCTHTKMNLAKAITRSGHQIEVKMHEHHFYKDACEELDISTGSIQCRLIQAA